MSTLDIDDVLAKVREIWGTVSPYRVGFVTGAMDPAETRCSYEPGSSREKRFLEGRKKGRKAGPKGLEELAKSMHSDRKEGIPHFEDFV